MSGDDWFDRDRSSGDDESGDDGPPADDWFERGQRSSDDESDDGAPTTDDFEAAFGGDNAEPTTDDFAAAFDGTAGNGDPDSGLETPTSGDFDEPFDSDIPRIELGVTGLDRMIQGGVPERSLMVVMGSAGTGKTTFGLQFLNRGLEANEKAVYITLEESAGAIRRAATEKGWHFDEYIDDNRLAVVDIDPIEMANSLTSIRGDLSRLITAFGADRLVLDSVSLLEMMYDEQSKRRTEVFDFTKTLKRAGVTTMLTSEASDADPYTSKHGIIEYLTDAVFILQYIRSEFGETRLAVEIQKIRNANHSRETKPYEITGEGISVYRQADIF